MSTIINRMHYIESFFTDSLEYPVFVTIPIICFQNFILNFIVVVYFYGAAEMHDILIINLLFYLIVKKYKVERNVIIYIAMFLAGQF